MRSAILGLVTGLLASFLLHRGTVPLAWLAVLLVGCAAVNLLCAALFPTAVARVRGRLEATPLRAFLSGLLAVLVVVLLLTHLAPPLRGLAALLSLATGLVLLLRGAPAATAAWMGERLAPEQSGRRQLVLGTGVWGACLVVPVVGWLLAAGLALSGLGASLLSLRGTPA